MPKKIGCYHYQPFRVAHPGGPGPRPLLAKVQIFAREILKPWIELSSTKGPGFYPFQFTADMTSTQTLNPFQWNFIFCFVDLLIQVLKLIFFCWPHSGCPPLQNVRTSIVCLSTQWEKVTFYSHNISNFVTLICSSRSWKILNAKF